MTSIEQTLERKKTGGSDLSAAYSNGLLGRIRHQLDGGNLEIIGGNFSGQIAKARHFMDDLPSLPVSPTEKPHEYKEFTLGFTNAIGVVVGVVRPDMSDERYIQQIGGEDMKNAPAMAMDLVSAANSARQTAIRVIYGATEEIPFRALSYILPSLLFMESIVGANLKVPQLQVIFANHISAKLKGLDFMKIRDQSVRFVDFAHRYIGEFFPGFTNNVIFLEDTILEESSVREEELTGLAQIVREKTPQKLLEELYKKGNNESSEAHLYYGAAHFFMHDIDLPESLTPIISGQPGIVHADNIISIGGYQEQFFYKLRHVLKPFIDEKFKKARTLQFFTRHRVPPYYMARGGDISLDSVLGSNLSFHERVAEAVKFDLDYLRAVSSYRGDLTQFLREMSRYEE